MPDEIVTIRIDFEANKRDMAAVLAELKGFSAAADAASDSAGKMSKSTDKMKDSVKKMDDPVASMTQRFNGLESAGRRNNKMLSGGNKMTTLFRKSAKLLMFQMIALVGEFVITAAVLASVNLAFKLGQYAVKAYNLALGAAGAALASIAVIASGAVAAFREFNAAAAAYQYKGANVYGSATAAASASMRGLFADTNLATMGVTQLTQAYKAMSSQGRVTGAQTKAISGAMDFTARSADQGKSFQAMANFVAIINKEGKVTSKATTAATGVSKEFADAVKNSKDKSAGGILASMSSGSLSKQAGVSGEFGSIKGTLVAQFKQITTFIARDMADFGDQFLDDMSNVLDGLYKNVRNVFARLAPEFASFGKGKLFPSITTIGNALEKFSVLLVRKYLPMLFGASAYLKKIIGRFKEAFFEFRNSLEKFREGSKIITDTFKGPIFAIFKIFGRNAEQLGYLAQDNEEQFKAWGGALEELIFAIGDWFAALKVAFTEALPVLTAIVNVLSDLISGMASVVKGIGTFKLGGGEGPLGIGGTGGGPSGTVGGGLGGGIGSLAIGALMFGAFKGRRRAYRSARMGSLQDAGNYASRNAARDFRPSMSERAFGGIPAMMTRSYYQKAPGGRMTPGEFVAQQAYQNKRIADGRSFADPSSPYGSSRTRLDVYGAHQMGIGGDRIEYEKGTGSRIGFKRLGDYGSHMSSAGPKGMKDTMSGRMLASDIRFATHGITDDKARREAVHRATASHMARAQTGRELMYGSAGLGNFFRGGQISAQIMDPVTGLPTGATESMQRKSQFSLLSSRRLRDDMAAAKVAPTMASVGGMSFPVGGGTPYQIAREKAFQEFKKADMDKTGKYFNKVTGEEQKAGKSQRAAERAFARQQFKTAGKATFAGTGEALQGSLKKSFNPMMGMMGGMVLSSGVTNRIKDEEFRGATNNALQYGAMFGARGMGIAAGVTLMKSENTGKSMLGGAMAGAAVGKTVADTLGPVFGPMGPMAKLAIIGGSALIGGMVGVFKAQGNRERNQAKTGAAIAERMTGQVGRAMQGLVLDPTTGNYKKTGKKSFQAGLTESRKQNRSLQSAVAGFDVNANSVLEASGSTKSQRQVIEDLFATGNMDQSEYAKSLKYLDQAEGGDNGAFKSTQALIRGALKARFGRKTSMDGNQRKTEIRGSARQTEDFFTKPGVRGTLKMDKKALISPAEMEDVMLFRGNFVVTRLAKITGKTEEEIMSLAKTMDVNLGDPTQSLTDHMEGLGQAMRKTAEEVAQAMRDIQVGALNVYDEEQKKRSVVSAFTASENNLRQLGGSASLTDFEDYARTSLAAAQARDPKNAFIGLDAMKNFSEGGLSGGEAMAGGLLNSFNKDGKTQATLAYNTALSQTAALDSQQIMGGMAEKNFVFRNLGAGDALQGLLRGVYGSSDYSTDEKKALSDFNATGELLDKDGKFNFDKLEDLGGAGAALADLLKRSSAGGTFETETSSVAMIEGTVELGTETQKLITDLGTAFATGIKGLSEDDTPQWFTQMKNYQWQATDNTLKLVNMNGDTRTSRRGALGDTSTSKALRGTMSSHSRFNSMLTGKRTVTSALRFNNLGSLSSDHAAGRAYDLTGDNLGQYQRLVSSSGGFAEFHGRGGSRHLHVVPPIGDSSTSRVRSGAGSTMNQNVTVNVYGTQGQSESAVARHVVDALEQQQRAYRERS